MPRLAQVASDAAPPRVRVPQLRVLAALAGDDPDNPPALTRARLCEACGFSPISGTVTSALNGVPPNSSHGAAYDGLVTLRLVERCEIDVDGAVELVFAITPLGLAALASQRGELPPLRDAASSTNRRYRNEEEGAS